MRPPRERTSRVRSGAGAGALRREQKTKMSGNKIQHSKTSKKATTRKLSISLVLLRCAAQTQDGDLWARAKADGQADRACAARDVELCVVALVMAAQVFELVDEADGRANDGETQLAAVRMSAQDQGDAFGLRQIEHDGLMRQKDRRLARVHAVQGARKIAFGPRPIINANELERLIAARNRRVRVLKHIDVRACERTRGQLRVGVMIVIAEHGPDACCRVEPPQHLGARRDV